MKKEIYIVREFNHSIERVWFAISNSEALASWLMPNNFKLEAGTDFQFIAPKQPGFDGIVRCRLIDFEIPHYLRYSWQGGPLKNATTVTFRLKSLGQNRTQMEFTHAGFEGFIASYIVRFILGQGWKSLLSKKIVEYLNK